MHGRPRDLEIDRAIGEAGRFPELRRTFYKRAMGGTAELLTSRFSTSPSADSCDWTMRDSPRSISSDPINPAQSAVDEAGAVFVSLHSHNRVERYDPGTGSLETFARLSAPVTGLAFGPDGALWATGGAVGRVPGYVWRINRGGISEEWVQIPDGVFMNGCTPHTDGRTLLVCESVTGRVLAVDQRERRWRVWIADDRLRPERTQTPGANGIKLRDGWACVDLRDDLVRFTPRRSSRF